jgi:hypothetical protein
MLCHGSRVVSRYHLHTALAPIESARVALPARGRPLHQSVACTQVLDPLVAKAAALDACHMMTGLHIDLSQF